MTPEERRIARVLRWSQTLSAHFAEQKALAAENEQLRADLEAMPTAPEALAALEQRWMRLQSRLGTLESAAASRRWWVWLIVLFAMAWAVGGGVAIMQIRELDRRQQAESRRAKAAEAESQRLGAKLSAAEEDAKGKNRQIEDKNTELSKLERRVDELAQLGGVEQVGEPLLRVVPSENGELVNRFDWSFRVRNLRQASAMIVVAFYCMNESGVSERWHDAGLVAPESEKTLTGRALIPLETCFVNPDRSTVAAGAVKDGERRRPFWIKRF